MFSHRDEIEEKPYDNDRDFLSIDTQLCIVPITKDEKFPENIVGTGFLIGFNGLSYVVTAKHVLKDLENPHIVFSDKKVEPWPIGTSVFSQFEIKWLEHPDGMDVIAIPIILPAQIDKEIINRELSVKITIPPEKIIPQSVVKHFGFGGKRTGKNKHTGKPIATPAGIEGLFISGNPKEILIRSSAEQGDSGGPLFVKQDEKAGTIIGVVSMTSTLTTITNPHQGQYTGKTTAIPIMESFKILNSDKMKKQVEIGLEKKKEYGNTFET